MTPKPRQLRVRIVEPAPLMTPVSRDVDDDVVLATAVAAAALSVTGDQDLLVIARHNGVDIVSPRDFLKTSVMLISASSGGGIDLAATCAR